MAKTTRLFQLVDYLAILILLTFLTSGFWSITTTAFSYVAKQLGSSYRRILVDVADWTAHHSVLRIAKLSVAVATVWTCARPLYWAFERIWHPTQDLQEVPTLFWAIIRGCMIASRIIDPLDFYSLYQTQKRVNDMLIDFLMDADENLVNLNDKMNRMERQLNSALPRASWSDL